MTVSTTTLKNSYSGNGSTTAFAYGFKVFASSELKVFIRSSAGAETLKTEGTGSANYGVSGVGSSSGGNVTFVTAPASGETVVILRDTALTQSLDLVENDPFLSDSFEDSLDKLTHTVQELDEEVQRSFKVSKTNSITTPEFTDSASDRASRLLGFSSDGNTLEATTGRVNTVTVSNVATSSGAPGTATASFTTTSGALALGIPVGQTGHAGVSMQYSTTTTDSDPGAGFIRLNNTSLNSATIMYVDDSDGTTDISAWVQSWDNSSSGSKGFITLSGNPNSASPLVIFKVNGAVTDASGYTKIPVAYVSGSTSITNSAEISVQFSPAGDGDVAGLDYTFSTTTTDSDPGTGVLRLNHGTIGSASAIYIDDSDANSADVSAYLLTWDDSTNSADRGQIYITKKSAPANFAIFKVSGASTDASGYVKLAVTHVSSSGSFSDTDPIAVEFNRTGNAGADGTMSGPGSSTDNAVARFNGTSGETVQNSGVTLDDSNNMTFPDAAKAQFGAGADLKIWHDGTHSHIDNDGAGALFIASNSMYITNSDRDENFILGADNGAVTLYHDNSAKIATSATGVSITGTLVATTDTDTSNTGSVTLDFGANQNFVLTLTGNVTLANPSTEQVGQAGVIVCIQDGTGSRTLSLGTDYETAGGAGITLSTAASAVDVIPYFVKASGSIQLGAVQLAFA
tara:strand:+ start:82 stop:2136 length:2055 start_codon:yes stop_codon:yes gene_type:complete